MNNVKIFLTAHGGAQLQIKKESLHEKEFWDSGMYSAVLKF